MNKKILLLMGVFCTSVIYAQVGINTENPLGVFHIDPQKNTTSTTVGVNDDILITNTGNVGIGTATPPNKLSVISTGADTGLYLPNGASSGKVLTSDVNGNGVWVSGAVQYQTMVYSNGGDVFFSGAIFPNFIKIGGFNSVVFDGAADVYGPSYGWHIGTQQYVAPVTGVYRMVMSVYFKPTGIIGTNYRAYWHKNGMQFLTPGIISVTDSGNDIIGYTMGIAVLNQGDIIDIRLASRTSGNVVFYAGEGHSFILIESL